MTPSTAVSKRSMTIAGHRTSISLEDAFWTGLRDIAGRRGVTPAALVADVDRGRANANLSSAIRVFVLANLHLPTQGHYTTSAAVDLPDPHVAAASSTPPLPRAR